MASRKFTTVDPAVRERRLRQIYELLDSGNNKRVLQEVDRLLKKMPDITCAKVLKALALLRMGKPTECEVILDPIVKETQTDDSVIQALSICYRELDKPEMVCQVLEKASQQDKSEDVMTNMFMAYARVGEYQKQHQTALALYKTYPKTPYFSWAIMSLYAKAVIHPDPLVQKVSLPLAERMMSKFITDNKIDSEYELTLYCLILRQQRKYDKLLELLESSFVKQSQSDVAGFYFKNKVLCLTELGMQDELAKFMEDNLIKNPDDYKSYAEYVKSFGSNNSDRVIKFIKERITEKRGRSCLLAYLYLYQFLFDQGITPQAEMDPISVFKTYAEDYGNKPSFFMDLCGFLSGLQKPDAKDAFLSIMKDFIHEPIDFMQPKEVQRQVNFRYMSRFFSHRRDLNAEKLLNYVNNSISLYLEGNETVANESKKGNTLDDLALFEFITLSSLTLLDSYWFGSESWKGILKKLQENPKKYGVVDDVNATSGRRNLPKGFNKLHGSTSVSNNVSNDHKSGKKNDHGTDDEDKGEDPDEKLDSILDTADALTKQMEKVSLKDYSLKDEDFPVLLTLALLEHGVSRSIKNAQLRILLSKAYIKCGAVGAGADSVIALDMKHMQWESLGYLYIWKLTSTGHMQEATRIFKLADNFYTTFQRENMEFVISAYKYGSWEKVLEFLEFGDLLLNSVQHPKLRIERHLLEYSKSVATVDVHASSGSYKSAQILTPLEIAQRGDLTLKSLSINKDFSESRDFGVLLTYSEEKVSKDMKELTHKADVHSLKLRALVALLLDKFVICSYEGNLTSKAEEIEIELRLLAEHAQSDCSTYEVDQIPIDGMWPPRAHQYVKTGHADLLLCMFRLTYEFGKHSTVEVVTKAASDVKAKLESITKQITPVWSSTSHTLLNRLVKLESFYEYVESLGFCVLLIDVCKQWVKTSSSDKTKKKKKAKEVPTDPTQEATLHCFRDLLGAFATALKSLDETIAANPLTDHDSFPTEWESMSETWAKLVGTDLCTYILPYSLPIVMRKLRLSYDRSCADLKHSIHWKKSHLDSLISNL